jgi:hypothetical protein
VKQRDDPGRSDPLRDLFAHVGPRAAPPASVEAEIRAAVFAEWDTLMRRRVLFRRLGAAAAAAVIVGVFAALLLRTGTTPTAVVASVERVRGNVEVDGVALVIGSQVANAGRIQTHGGQVALRLVSGGSLRLAPQTELTFSGSGLANLNAGAVYFDSEDGAATRRLEVQTALGTLRDVGTQFVARLVSDQLEVGVRGGSVAITRAGDSINVRPGERVSVASGASTPRRQAIATFGDDWSWAERLAPPFAIDGRPLIEFLHWVEAQTGRTLVFADAASEQASRDTVLSGSIDLEPLQKLAAVMATTDLGYALAGERIVIRAAK